MKRSLILVAAVAALVGAVTASVGLLAAPASSAGTAKPWPGLRLLPPATPAGQMSLYGHIASLRRTSGRFELRFDPAWFTGGVTARRAKRDSIAASCSGLSLRSASSFSACTSISSGIPYI